METSAPQDTPSLRVDPVKDSREKVREKLNLLGDLQRQVKVLEAQYEQLLSTTRRMSKSSEADRAKREALTAILRRAHQQLATMRNALSINCGGSDRSAKIQSLNGALCGALAGKAETKQPGLKIYPILEHGPEMEE